MFTDPFSIKRSRPARRRARLRPSFRAASVIAGLSLVALAASVLLHAGPVRAQGNPFKIKGSYQAGSSFYQAGVVACDINADGMQELLIGNQNGRLYCFDSRARPLWSYNTGAAIQATPACFDVDGDGRQEVFVGDMAGRMWAFDSSGKVLSKWGWPKRVRTTGGLSGIFSSPAIGDINGDGIADIVVGTYGQFIYAWDYTGNQLPGWPYNNEDTIWSSPALADLDYDGVKDVIIGADSTGGVNWPYPPGGLLYAFHGDGTVMAGFPRVTPEVTWSSPAVADIDGDGRYEIVVGTGHYYTQAGRLTTEARVVYAYNHDGGTLRGWPARVGGCTFSSPALGDINGDGTIETVIGTISVKGRGEESVAVISRTGKVLLEIKGYGGPIMGSPVLGDVNADGVADIVVGAGQRLLAWDSTGNELLRADLGNFVVGNPAVGDFDRDGRVEVAAATGDMPGGLFHGGAFYVFDCGPKLAASPGGDPALFPWPMFRRDAKHGATVLSGREPPPAAAGPGRNWYLAEGSTAGGMETWVLVENPNREAARVTVHYMTPNGPVEGPVVRMRPRSRRTINVADTVPNAWEVSTRVTADRPVVVERSMYGAGRVWAHDSVGSDKLSRTWYLAEGSTGGDTETWILVQNPNSASARVTLTYMTTKGLIAGPTAVLRPMSRKTFFAADTVPGRWSVSTRVTSDRPVVAERAMYGNGRTWAHCSRGSPTVAANWFLPEGCTAGGMETWVLVQNPLHPDAEVHLTFMTPSGPVNGPSAVLKPGTRATFNVADTVPNAWEVSTRVDADKGVIVERSTYGPGRVWANGSVGACYPGKTWNLPEGSTAGGMETWVLVQNPGARRAVVRLFYMTEDGEVAGPAVAIGPDSRRTFFVADTVKDRWSVSTQVTSDRPVVVERAMYGPGRVWSHDSIGQGQ
jgi:hypothetical protein